MDMLIVVGDAAGAPVPGARVVLSGSGAPVEGVTDASGRASLGVPERASVAIQVGHPRYLGEQVELTLQSAGGSFAWDNPVCTVREPATVEVRLSRLRAAPVLSVSDDDLERRTAFGPQAAFTWTDHNGNRTGRYLGTFNDRVDVVAVQHPLFPTAPTDGWGRIAHTPDPVSVDPSRTGQFVWLEWGLGGAEPRLSLAVWFPRAATPPSEIDVVYFFSPNTGNDKFPGDSFPWLGQYPYWALKGTAPLRPGGPPALVQPYLALAHRYLFSEKWLIAQLTAARRSAVVVFPVQPFGDWGPFGQVAGLARLTGEILHFLHRTGLAQSPDPSQQDLAPSPNYRFGRTGVQRPPPTVRRIVLSGFSAGMAPVIDMLGTQVGQRLNVQSMSHQLFGADVAPFLGSWKEVWDHDAPAPVRQQMDAGLPGWLRRDPSRMARCYQSDHTGSRAWFDSTPLTDFTPAAATAPVRAGSRERHATSRCSLVFFGDGYLHHASSARPVQPVFWTAADDHQAVPMVTFGHAAGLSGLAPSGR